MKKISLAIATLSLMTGFASAADLPARPYTKAPPPVAAAIYNWSGFYVGLNVGGAWGDDPFTYNPQYTGAPAGFPAKVAIDGSGKFRPSGVTAGGQAGYNWQVSQFVLGIEADVEYLDLKNSFTTPFLTFPGVFPYFIATSVKSNWMATVRPRVGVAFDRFLLYVTGGVAFSEVSFAQTITYTTVPATIGTGSASATKTGWVAGAGFEYAFAPRWSAKFEYLHADFGSIGFTAVVTNPVIASTSSASFRTDLARVGINYSFGGGPVVAKY
jgi:outer membrane immunogenic protein